MDDKVKNVLDTIQEDQSETTCPSCAHFCGTYETCPRCGAGVPKRLTVRLFRYIAVFLSTVGLAILYMWSLQLQPKLVQVKDITPSMNFGIAKIKGIVVENGVIRFDSNNKNPFLTFRIDDGTGVIQATAFRFIAEEMQEQDMIPLSGDNIELIGQLQVKAGPTQLYRSLLLRDTSHISLQRKTVPTMLAHDITLEHVGQTVKVAGSITEIRKPREGSKAPVSVFFKQQGHKGKITVWQNVYNELEKLSLSSGQNFEAIVQVAEYRRIIQLSLLSADRFKITGQSTPVGIPSVLCKDISKQTLENEIQVTGVISALIPPRPNSKAPAIATLKDTSGTGKLVIWKDDYEQLHNKGLKKGSKIVAKVRVSEFRGDFQLQLQAAEDLHFKTKDVVKGNNNTVVEKKPIKKPVIDESLPPIVVAIEQIDLKEHTNKKIVVEGELSQVTSFSKGFRLTLKSNASFLQVLLWQDVVDMIETLPRLGEQLRVEGYLKDSNGFVQLIPKTSENIKVIPPKDLIHIKNITDITKEHFDRLVEVHGSIENIGKLGNSGTSVTLRDSSGVITVVLWHKTFADEDGFIVSLQKDLKLRVYGKVAEYKGKLQIVPTSSVGVKILE